MTEKRDDPGDLQITFGQTHNGKLLKECPRSYIQWLSEQRTICGKSDIPRAAKAWLESLPPEPPRPLRYSIPITLEQADKLAWMVRKWNNREAARTLLAARDEKTHCFMVDVEDGDMGYFKVDDDGDGHFVGSFEAVEEEIREEQEQADRLTQWEANPTLNWVASNGKHVQVWAKDEFGDEADGYENEKKQWVSLYIIRINGAQHTYEISDVPVKQQTWAKQRGVVACLGPIGLTQERLNMLLEAAKEK